jgi:hypothetical protein
MANGYRCKCLAMANDYWLFGYWCKCLWLMAMAMVLLVLLVQVLANG